MTENQQTPNQQSTNYLANYQQSTKYFGQHLHDAAPFSLDNVKQAGSNIALDNYDFTKVNIAERA